MARVAAHGANAQNVDEVRSDVSEGFRQWFQKTIFSQKCDRSYGGVLF